MGLQSGGHLEECVFGNARRLNVTHDPTFVHHKIDGETVLFEGQKKRDR